MERTFLAAKPRARGVAEQRCSGHLTNERRFPRPQPRGSAPPARAIPARPGPAPRGGPQPAAGGGGGAERSGAEVNGARLRDAASPPAPGRAVPVLSRRPAACSPGPAGGKMGGRLLGCVVLLWLAGTSGSARWVELGSGGRPAGQFADTRPGGRGGGSGCEGRLPPRGGRGARRREPGGGRSVLGCGRWGRRPGTIGGTSPRSGGVRDESAALRLRGGRARASESRTGPLLLPRPAARGRRARGSRGSSGVGRRPGRGCERSGGEERRGRRAAFACFEPGTGGCGGLRQAGCQGGEGAGALPISHRYFTPPPVNPTEKTSGSSSLDLGFAGGKFGF